MSNLVVQTNVLALNSHRNLKVIGTKQSVASARLSSGYRINSAADDASGLAISEKMRAQIRGLDMASKNTQDGISLVQTAEGGLQEVDNMLQRIRELVVQAANDTNDYTTNDRQKIQDEINQLTQGIDDMAEQVEFNAKTLLDGSLLDKGTRSELLGDIDKKLAAAVGAVATVSASISQGSGELGSLFTKNSGGGSYTVAESEAEVTQATTGVFTTGMYNFTDTITVGTSASGPGGGTTASGTATNWTGGPGVTDPASSTDIINSDTLNGTGTDGGSVSYWTVTTTATNIQTANTTSGNSTVTLTASVAEKLATYGPMGTEVYATDDGLQDYIADLNEFISTVKADWASDSDGDPMNQATTDIITKAQESIDAAKKLRAGYELQQAQMGAYSELAEIEGEGLWFQTGSNSTQGINVGVGSIKTNILGIGNGSGESKIAVDQMSGMEVSNFIDIADDALQYVTAQRAKLGAVQNRMEYTKSSLDISSENLSASESRIRDTDMAKEMMKMTAANVLQQAGVSMLAQANQAPQSVLQLLG